MKKNIACPNCKGKGYNTVVTGDRNDYCGVANEMCPECNGTGLKLADMTNADRIRAMSNEELAKFIPDWSYTGACKCDEQPYVDCNNECDKCVLEWLKQPAEDWYCAEER